MVTMRHVDLIYDPNEVGSDLVVACLISQSPRAEDDSFDPRPGDVLLATDDDGEDFHGRVVRRQGNVVWIQLDLPGLLSAPAQ